MNDSQACRGSFRYLVCFIWLLLLSGCNSLPPTSPLDDNGEFFDPRYLTWQPAADLSPLTGDWYLDNSLFIELAQDSLALDQHVPAEWEIDASDSYYRIIYKSNSHYSVIFLNKLSPDSLRYIPGDTVFTSTEYADSVSASGQWKLLTNKIIWRKTGDMQDILGHWHLSDGNMELDVAVDQVLLNGTPWTLDEVQSYEHDINIIKRLVLSREDSTIAVYYRGVTDLYTAVKIWGSLESIQDRYGNIGGPWIALNRWYDILEESGFHNGAAFDYSYKLHSLVMYAPSTETVPRDSTYKWQNLYGNLHLAVSGAIEGNGAGELTFDARFEIGRDLGHYVKARKDTREVLADSSWDSPGSIVEARYTLVMENDTLWIQTDRGNVFFAPRRVDKNSRINQLIFTYPFDPPLDFFPDSAGLDAEVILPGETEPEPEFFDPGFDLGLRVSTSRSETFDGEQIYYETNYFVRQGGEKNSLVNLNKAGVLQNVEYLYSIYNRLWWTASSSTVPEQYVHEFSFTCDLENYLP